MLEPRVGRWSVAGGNAPIFVDLNAANFGWGRRPADQVDQVSGRTEIDCASVPGVVIESGPSMIRCYSSLSTRNDSKALDRTAVKRYGRERKDAACKTHAVFGATGFRRAPSVHERRVGYGRQGQEYL